MVPRQSRRWRQLLVILVSAVGTLGVSWVCTDSWRAVVADPSPSFDALIGVVASTVALVALSWWALAVVVVALSRAPGRIGLVTTWVARVVVPAAARHRVRITLGLTASVAQASVLVAPATAAPEQPVSSSVVHWAERAAGLPVGGSAHVDDLPPIGRPPVPPPSIVVPAPEPDPGPPEPVLPPSSRPNPILAAPGRVTVRHGDTLWDIAAEHLADPTPARVAHAWPLWFAANRDVIGSEPDLIHPGMVLVAPAPPTDSPPRSDR